MNAVNGFCAIFFALLLCLAGFLCCRCLDRAIFWFCGRSPVFTNAMHFLKFERVSPLIEHLVEFEIETELRCLSKVGS